MKKACNIYRLVGIVQTKVDFGRKVVLKIIVNLDYESNGNPFHSICHKVLVNLKGHSSQGDLMHPNIVDP